MPSIRTMTCSLPYLMQLCASFSKEHLKGSEDTPLTTYYTDRQGLPVCIDITGKEGKVKMTDNANFFCIGPSGSGKSFHMEKGRTKRKQAVVKYSVAIT